MLALAALVIYGPLDRSFVNDLGEELVATWTRLTHPENGDMVCASIRAVDGDTIKCLGGKSMRALGDGSPNRSGFDTPEIFSPKCPEELQLGRVAKARLQELVSQKGVTVTDSGVRDRYDRRLVWINLPDGRKAGSVLVEEGLARPWFPGYRADWCR
ncbi:MAG: thermonuclease family protein [Rhodobacteraceae bacterium]|nr:thermonuclease family protein [Paracoccaceae bacterium]